MLKNNGVHAKATGGTHWLQFLPDHVYCFLPSFEIDKGQVEIHDHIPDFVKDFYFCMEIEQVEKANPGSPKNESYLEKDSITSREQKEIGRVDKGSQIERQSNRNAVSKEFLSYNRFSVLEIEEMIVDESNDSNETLDIDQKSFKKQSKKPQKTKKTKDLPKKREEMDLGTSIKPKTEVLKLESSDKICSEFLRCKKCWETHFPYKKFCNWSISKDGEDIKNTDIKKGPDVIDMIFCFTVSAT